ncbi:hypothetical protein BU26DRAFT_352620 [Trematosphaeria pertusa]|uniref:Uncharacterized protein n=1 Tax=Trematosphaeria pertusa TaxID=390896 RepID=A0A6A6IAX5_9PLEO|nr:uncharacterized protein BU26DRAFT_352620 [Trematosphaeria pertusa]KAF2247725.1 hypothetical protein BU26DRAFT_352620 [Trematosphaeria pertusa]
MSQRVDYHWAQQELIPFLQSVFEWRLGNPGRTKAQWEADIRRAEGRINTVVSISTCLLRLCSLVLTYRFKRDYDDSIITIDRIRLAFANPSALTAADRVQTDTIIDDLDLCLTLFVRRAINHGAYRLCSLASGLNPAAMQEREILRQKGEKVPDIRRDLAR